MHDTDEQAMPSVKVHRSIRVLEVNGVTYAVSQGQRVLKDGNRV